MWCTWKHKATSLTFEYNSFYGFTVDYFITGRLDTVNASAFYTCKINNLSVFFFIFSCTSCCYLIIQQLKNILNVDLQAGIFPKVNVLHKNTKIQSNCWLLSKNNNRPTNYVSLAVCNPKKKVKVKLCYPHSVVSRKIDDLLKTQRKNDKRIMFLKGNFTSSKVNC